MPVKALSGKQVAALPRRDKKRTPLTKNKLTIRDLDTRARKGSARQAGELRRGLGRPQDGHLQ